MKNFLTRLRFWLAGLTTRQRSLITSGIIMNMEDWLRVNNASTVFKPENFQVWIDLLKKIKWNIELPATTGNWHCLWLTRPEVDLVEWGIILSKKECHLIMRALEAYMEHLHPPYKTRAEYVNFFNNQPVIYVKLSLLYERIFQYQVNAKAE